MKRELKWFVWSRGRNCKKLDTIFPISFHGSAWCCCSVGVYQVSAAFWTPRGSFWDPNPRATLLLLCLPLCPTHSFQSHRHVWLKWWPCLGQARAVICFTGISPSQRRRIPSPTRALSTRQYKGYIVPGGELKSSKPPTPAEARTFFIFLTVGQAYVLSNTAPGTSVLPQQMTPKRSLRCLGFEFSADHLPSSPSWMCQQSQQGPTAEAGVHMWTLDHNVIGPF